jgi:hypothetical protein
MWANFKSMPALLKFLTAQALFSFVFFVVSVIPNDQFSINGRHVTYSEWWSSGAGPFASVLGVFGLYTAWLFLTKGQYARAWYLVFLAIFRAACLCFGRACGRRNWGALSPQVAKRAGVLRP